MFPSIVLGFSRDNGEIGNEDTRLSRRNLRDASNILEIPDEQQVYRKKNRIVLPFILSDL